MPRVAKPFEHRGWYKTDIGGTRHKLCPVDEGLAKAKLELCKLQVRLADGAVQAEASLAPAPAVPAHLRLVGDAYNEFLSFKKPTVAGETWTQLRDKLQPLYDRFGDRPLRGLTAQDGVAYM